MLEQLTRNTLIIFLPSLYSYIATFVKTSYEKRRDEIETIRLCEPKIIREAQKFWFSVTVDKCWKNLGARLVFHVSSCLKSYIGFQRMKYKMQSVHNKW